ncbi:tetratricopeptide repeat protein [Thalassotalea euphylliae]|nr:tetratricopeptide repeat protein [Thalassotalea euphylliae]
MGVLASALWIQGVQAEHSGKLAPSEDIHTICALSPRQCLVSTEKLLTQEPSESRRWFQYKTYQFDALFQLLDIEALARELAPWLDRDDIPLKFKISVLIYSAKTLPESQKALANQQMNQAIEVLEQINEAHRDPLIVVQIANALNQQGEYQRGYDMLMPLVAKYQHRYMPRFKHELFENLGHFALRLNKLGDHLEYRQLALEWARALGNNIQVAISLYNVARAYQMLSDYSNAMDYFMQAEQLEALGPNDQNLINFRRAEMSLAQGRLDEAIEYYGKVDKVIGAKFYRALLSEFELALTQAKSASQSAE